MNARSAFLYGSMLSAAFGIIWLPILMRQPKAFVSPYSKADIQKRAWAATADGLLVGTCLLLYLTRDSMLFIAAGATYLLLKDAFIPGQSVGKFLVGLRVITLDTGRPCGRWHSAQRNFILVVPGLNVVAAVLETLEMVRDTQGQRLGDRLANTQVVDGLSVKEVATSAALPHWAAALRRAARNDPGGRAAVSKVA